MNKILSLIFLAILAAGCNKDSGNERPDPTDPINSAVYQLEGTTNSNISGAARFVRNQDNSTTVFISLINASSEIHPASIHYNSVEEGGGLAISLNACLCAESETTITNLDNGNPINFDQLMVFDGHINIYESEVLNTIVIAQVNIGSNAN